MNALVQTDSTMSPGTKRAVPANSTFAEPETAFDFVFVELAQAGHNQSRDVDVQTEPVGLDASGEESLENVAGSSVPTFGKATLLGDSNSILEGAHSPALTHPETPAESQTQDSRQGILVSGRHDQPHVGQQNLGKFSLVERTQNTSSSIASGALDLTHSTAKNAPNTTKDAQNAPGPEKQSLAQTALGLSFRGTVNPSVAHPVTQATASIESSLKATPTPSSPLAANSSELIPLAKGVKATTDDFLNTLHSRSELPSAQSLLHQGASGKHALGTPRQYRGHNASESPLVIGQGPEHQNNSVEQANQTILTPSPKPTSGTAKRDLPTAQRLSVGVVSAFSLDRPTAQHSSVDEVSVQGASAQQILTQNPAQNHIATTQFLIADTNTPHSERGLHQEIEIAGMASLQGTGGAVTSSRTENLELPRVAQQVIDVMPRRPNQSVEIVLNPEELGKVRMTITGSETQITVSIQAERAETTELMRRHLDLLTEQYHSLGYSDIQYSFDDQKEQHQGAEPPSEQKRSTDEAEIEQSILTTQDFPTTGIDIRV